jgi:hypothetical protein
MKKMMFLAMMMAMTITANAMSYRAARDEALFLSDKMAYELNLTDAQYEAVYEINLDYLMSVNGRADVFGPWWDRRNADLRYVLSTWQYARFLDRTYFYRPVTWRNGGLTIHVYSHYDRARFYRHHPTVYVTYRGGHNRKPSHFYANRRLAKPAPAPAVRHHNPPKHDKVVGGPHHAPKHDKAVRGSHHVIAKNTPADRGPGHDRGRR